mgnify:CR=1 FL=1
MARKSPSGKVKTAERGVAANRRKFLKAASGVAGGAALAFPMIAKGQTGPISMRWQSTWPSKDIFHEYALDYAKKVNDMTGGDLKIEVLPAGAVVPAFGLLDAVSKGTLDGGHGVLVYHYGKQNALALWGSGPAYGMDGNMLLAWHKYGGGRSCCSKLYASIGAERGLVSLRSAPDAAARLVQEADHQGRGLQGHEVPHRSGISIDLFTGMGAAVNALPGGEIVPAMDRGLLDARRVQQRVLRPHRSASRTCPRCACCRASTRTPSSSRSRSTRPSTMRCRTRCRRSSRYAVEAASAGHVVEGDRPLFEGLHRAADEGQGQVLQDAGCDPAEAARDLTTRSSRRSRRTIRCSRRSSSRRRHSPSAR